MLATSIAAYCMLQLRPNDADRLGMLAWELMERSEHSELETRYGMSQKSKYF